MEVVEENEIVLKASGYDNVDVRSLTLRGVQLQGGAYVVTGDLQHEVSGAGFAPQPVPGTVHAFTAIRLVT